MLPRYRLPRYRFPITFVTFVSFLVGTFPVRPAYAQVEEPDPISEEAPSAASPPAAEGREGGAAAQLDASRTEKPPSQDASRSQSTARTTKPMSSPVGGDKTGVSTQAISLPQGAGKVQGMGESFSTQLSTGVASYQVPFALPAARGAAQPALSLNYNSGSGHGLSGVGWDVGWPYIARQTDRGLPHYDDRAAWHAEQDHFVFGGGQELVPICVVATGGACAGALAGEVMPAWAGGWQYFRPRVEGAYMRFFWSPDHKTWRVQGKSEQMELGVPLDGSRYAGALEADPANPARIFRWNVARAYDAHGSPSPAGSATPAPVNVVAYRYELRNGMAYLSDLYDTPPVANAASAPLSAYAHHTKLVYQPRTDPTFSFRRGFRVDQMQRLLRVDVTSKTFSSAAEARRMVRRYHLSYDPSYRVSLLTSVQLEGRCGGSESQAPAENSSERLPDVTGCATLPPMTFDYQHVSPYRVDGSPGTRPLAGHEGFDERIRGMANSPKYYLDKTRLDLFDVNSDALPDVLVTEAEEFNQVYGVFFNGSAGRADSFGASSRMTLNAVGSDGYGTIRLSNDNLAVMDLDGDATIDLINMPLGQRQYSVYSPQYRNGAWVLQGRLVATADGQNSRINFANNDNIRMMDANGDGLSDVVLTDGTAVRTYLSLGRYPRGDSQYGVATWTSATTSAISNAPIAKCLLTDGADPVSFQDPAIRIADLNADGLPDVVRLYHGNIVYWPGRGNGLFGTGDLNCPEGEYASGRHLPMLNSPEFVADATDPRLQLEDLNADGFDDLVELGDRGSTIWLNEGGAGWTNGHYAATQRSDATDFVRIADMNASGSRDIFFFTGNDYRYVDLSGGVRPWVLTRASNGLGKATEIQYSTSTAMMLAAEASGSPWTSKAPMPLHVVSKVTERDNLQAVGRAGGVYVTEYVYRDAVFDGRQREFRGFRTTTARRPGDANSPTSVSQSTFLLGECADDEPPPAGVSSRCAPDGRWVDNPREGLKGLPRTSETFDEAGKYVSTEHTTHRFRKLYAGLDGRQVRATFASQTDTYAYDVASFASSTSQVTLADVELELRPGVISADLTSSVTLRSTTGRAHLRKTTSADVFGNETANVNAGCVDGCLAVDESITSHTTPGRRSDDASGWIWRTVESYVTGSSNPSARRRRTLTEYNQVGDATRTTAELTGTVPLDRFHEEGRSIALPPVGASADGMITVSTQEYDPFGNVTRQTAPNRRCRQIKPDTDFAALPISETVYVGAASGSCGGRALTAYAFHDRGIAAPTSVIDLHGELSSLAHDGFGRLVSMRKPSPTQIGATSPIDSVKVEYFLPANPATTPYVLVHTQTQDGATDVDATYRSAWSFVDGLGRAIVTLEEADTTAGDGGQWIVSGMVTYDGKGAVSRAFEPWFWNGDPKSFPLGMAPPTRFAQKGYDAFGRAVKVYALDGALALRSDYHAISVDAWDAEDLGTGPHAGTFATERKDGHGRTIALTERIHVGTGIEARETQTTYLPSGEPATIRRVRGSDVVVRSIQYDSLGRMVRGIEPNTSKGEKTWRYAYSDNGDLVGTSEARGCGTNYHYDSGGRIVAEDYSPCLKGHAAYSPPDLVTGDGTEAYYHYDTPDPSVPATIDDCTINANLLPGRVASVSDRASKVVTSFDGRGRALCVARLVAKPGAPSAAVSSRYAPGWYTQAVAYDGADRPTRASTGAKVAELLGQDDTSFVSTAYSARGAVKSIGGSYGVLVSSVTRAADGRVGRVSYGDAAATKTDFTYDVRRRVSTVQTYRGPPALWSQNPPAYTPAPAPGGPPTSFQLTLEKVGYGYDQVDNPTTIQDQRAPADWPAGAKPVTRTAQYDDLYRLTRMDYGYEGGGDTWTSPFQSENEGGRDPRRASPSPHLGFSKRVLSQTYQYDWLGNTASTTDDAGGFYERSLGTITNGTAAAGPYQLRTANGGAAPRNGSLTTRYDDAGNLVGLSVARNASAPCLPAGTSCSQRFAYEWDEVGRLASARRWDGSGLGTASDPLPAAVPNVELEYAYDATDERVLKSATSAGTEVHTVYPFDSLELRRTTWNGTDYERNAWTEVPYLFAHGVRVARLHYADTSVPTMTNGQLHVLFELPDHLGSSTIVVDKATGELVERSTYQAYGGAESDYRPERWDAFREDYRFTGKEEDVEVGLLYFGKRYLSPALNRWASADPLAVHAAGSADLNLYAYVHGAVLRAVDPVGLDEFDADKLTTYFQQNGLGAIADPDYASRTGAQVGANTERRAQDRAFGDYVANNGDPRPPPPGASRVKVRGAGVPLMPLSGAGVLAHGLGQKALNDAEGTPVLGGVIDIARGDTGMGVAKLSLDALTFGKAGVFKAMARLELRMPSLLRQAVVDQRGSGSFGPLFGGGGRTVFRALSAGDAAALDAGEDLVAKGVGGTPAQHVLGERTGYISAAETLGAARRFESEFGVVEIDVALALDFGTTTVEQGSIVRNIRRTLDGRDLTRALRDTKRAEELLFEEFIPHEAIVKRH